MISLLSFWLFFGLSLCQSQQRIFLRNKSYQDWLLDIAGLCSQGAIIPLLQLVLAIKVYGGLWPNLKNYLDLPAVITFLIGFVVVDYIYYWSHRGLHCRYLFPIHQVHHSLSQMDLVGCSRNTLWTSLLLPYVWLNGLWIFLLHDPRGYLTAIALTYLLDLWRHSSLTIPSNSWLYFCLNPWLILPQDHAQHHGHIDGGQRGVNFGANLKIWDKIHGTYGDGKQIQPLTNLGIKLELNLLQKLFWPFPSLP